MTDKKNGMFSIVGRPNVGKSTLVNALTGDKVAIVTNKPQTTRKRIFGILTENEKQYVFIDTPGMHRPRSKLGEFMVGVVRESVTDIDACLMLVAPVANIGAPEAALIERMSACKTPCVLIINKIDTVPAGRILEVIEAYRGAYQFESIIPISAKTGEGLRLILPELDRFMSSGEFLFPEDMTSDQPERQMAAEIIREKVLTLLDREVPHGVAVEITEFSERSGGIIDVSATIYCEKNSHKGIIIGKKGEMLGNIGKLARLEIEEMYGEKVMLRLWVKIKENWRDNPGGLKNFGYM